jgi:diguanylate cyclase (GGDEF)-like protein
MQSPAPLASRVSVARPDPPRAWRVVQPRRILARIRESEYATVGASARFRAVQRRRTVAASRVGFVVIAGAVFFDAIALYDLQPGMGPILLALNGTVAALALLGVYALGHGLRRRPEPITGLVTLAVTFATAMTAFLVPELAIQTIGYLLLIPGLVALIVPWSTRAHVRWLAAYALIAFGYLMLGPSPVLSAVDRSDLIVVGVIAVATSLAGHVLLQRAQIRNHTQLQKIQSLHRRADADMAELARVHHALEETARVDPLTGAGNRLRLREDLRSTRARMNRLHHSYGLVAIDLDHFKRVNDELGHLAGDAALKAVVAAIKETIRAEDAIYRFGGEEFLIVLRLDTFDNLTTAAERLRCAVVDARIAHPANEPLGVVTISLGCVLLAPADLEQSDDEWFARADAALYRAKANGRNRAEVTA